MTLRTKRLPFVSRPRAFPKFNASDESNFFVQQFVEPLQLFFCLLVVETLTLKLRLKAAFLGLQNRYLAFCLLKTVERKRKTLPNYLGYRQIFDNISGDDLLESPELKRQLREAKEREANRRADGQEDRKS